MNCLFNACAAAIFARTGSVAVKNSFCGYLTSTWGKSFQNAGVRSVNLNILVKRFCYRCYSSRKASKSKSQSKKLDPESAMGDKDAFFVVRKGNLIGIYKNLSDCQAQVGNSICNPPVSVYKGRPMPKESKEYLLSFGLKNALYSIRAEDLKEDIFGKLVPCPFQPSSSGGETFFKDLPMKRSQEFLGSAIGNGMGTSAPNEAIRKHAKLDYSAEAESLSSARSCILKFDGASKGNPGQAGAGAVLLSEDGSLICRLREGLGIATNNAAEYRGMILGLRYALQKGYSNIRVLGDSKLVCMQVQGLWKVKNQNMSSLYEEAKKLKDKFLSFQINHVLRDLNSDADAQANLAIHLADGQVQEEIDN